MDKTWILQRLKRMIDDPDLYDELLDSLDNDEIAPILAKVNPNGDIVYQLLDKDAKVIDKKYEL